MNEPRIVGAYAAMPAERPDAEAFYRALHDGGVDGIEIPYIVGLSDDLPWFAEQIRPFTSSVVTAIPATMKRVGADPTFGLASPTPESALAFVRDVCDEIGRLHELAGPVVRWLQIHSAPRGGGDREVFASSLATVTAWCRDIGVTPVVEHCDDHLGKTPEKGFLTFEDERDACRQTGTPMTINWGRAVLERHDAERPGELIAALVGDGLLGGVMFSGIGPDQTQYGPAWGDAHLPLVGDEPTSWMTADHVARHYAAAQGQALYSGVKIQVPAVSVPERVAMIGRVFEAMGDHR